MQYRILAGVCIDHLLVYTPCCEGAMSGLGLIVSEDLAGGRCRYAVITNLAHLTTGGLERHVARRWARHGNFVQWCRLRLPRFRTWQ